MGNLEEMEKFLERYKLPRLNLEEIQNMNRSITRAKLKFVIKKTPDRQKSRIRRLHR